MFGTLARMAIVAATLLSLVACSSGKVSGNDGAVSSAASDQVTVFSNTYPEEARSPSAQARAADLIVRGKVIAVGEARESEQPAAATRDTVIYRDIEVQVEKVLKGTPREQRSGVIRVRVRGGRVGDQQMLDTGQPSFTESEEVMLFLTSEPSLLFPTEGGFSYLTVFGVHGKYKVKDRKAVRGTEGSAIYAEYDLDELESASR